MKSTEVDESLSTNATRVLFQRETTLLLQIYCYLSYDIFETGLCCFLPYLSFDSQLNVGCCMMGLPFLSWVPHSAFYHCCLFSLQLWAVLPLSVSITAWAIACIKVSCWVAILDLLCICSKAAFVRLPDLSLFIFYMLMCSASVCLVETFTLDIMCCNLPYWR